MRRSTVEGLPAKGVKNLVMIMPGFSADCVETLEEVAIGLDETFKHAGGVNFSAVPCLNDSPAFDWHAGNTCAAGVARLG